MSQEAKHPVITLTTDFGLTDAYVAVMKGIILEICPFAMLVDVSHEVPPQAVGDAAQLLEAVWRYFPSDAIHLGVVDPGVGTKRRPIAVRASQGTFVGPDNGLFAPALVAQGAIGEDGRLTGAEAVELTAREFQRPEISQTFQGRDIFAPAAAHLASGLPISRLGSSITTIAQLDKPRLVVRETFVEGVVDRVDRFGNLITNIPASLLSATVVVELASTQITGLASSYQDADLVALVGSHGCLEIAGRNDNASRKLGVSRGSTVRVVRAPGPVRPNP